MKTKTLEEKVKEYIKECGYTWTYEGIMEQYKKQIRGEYISFTAKDVIKNVIKKHLQEYHENNY